MSFNPDLFTVDGSRSKESISIFFEELRKSSNDAYYFPEQDIADVERNFLDNRWYYLLCYNGIPSAAVWLENFVSSSAYIHFFVFDTVNNVQLVPSAKIFLKKLFEKSRQELYCLLGLIEENNRKARLSAALIGFKKQGVLKHYTGKNKNIVLYTINPEDL